MVGKEVETTIGIHINHKFRCLLVYIFTSKPEPLVPLDIYNLAHGNRLKCFSAGEALGSNGLYPAHQSDLVWLHPILIISVSSNSV
ncbi:hypothetical protein OKW21_000954 [Catalinimonas alkaloidigena]|nr:hypothetical protein [Catalinimonas alkaloidigena]